MKRFQTLLFVLRAAAVALAAMLLLGISLGAEDNSRARLRLRLGEQARRRDPASGDRPSNRSRTQGAGRSPTRRTTGRAGSARVTPAQGTAHGDESVWTVLRREEVNRITLAGGSRTALKS